MNLNDTIMQLTQKCEELNKAAEVALANLSERTKEIFKMDDDNNVFEGFLYQEPDLIAEYKIINNIVKITDKKQIPNRFVRFMQKHILGITWKIY